MEALPLSWGVVPVIIGGQAIVEPWPFRTAGIAVGINLAERSSSGILVKFAFWIQSVTDWRRRDTMPFGLPVRFTVVVRRHPIHVLRPASSLIAPKPAIAIPAIFVQWDRTLQRFGENVE